MRKSSLIACVESPIKINYSANLKSCMNRLNKVFVFTISFLPCLLWHVVTVYFAAIDIVNVLVCFL